MLLSQLMTAQTEAKIKRIRETYAQAQKCAAHIGTEEWMEHGAHSMTFNSLSNYSGGGPIGKEIQVLLYVEDDYEKAMFNTARPWLTREKIYRGEGFLYRELLFDPENDDALLFCFQRVTQPDGSAVELRFYYDNGKLIRALPDDTKPMYTYDPQEVLKSAEALKASIKSFEEL